MMNSYKLAERINSDVNASVTYKTDLAQYGTPEHWCLPTDFGDCEDYALTLDATQHKQAHRLVLSVVLLCLSQRLQHLCVFPSKG